MRVWPAMFNVDTTASVTDQRASDRCSQLAGIFGQQESWKSLLCDWRLVCLAENQFVGASEVWLVCGKISYPLIVHTTSQIHICDVMWHHDFIKPQTGTGHLFSQNRHGLHNPNLKYDGLILNTWFYKNRLTWAFYIDSYGEWQHLPLTILVNVKCCMFALFKKINRLFLGYQIWKFF